MLVMDRDDYMDKTLALLADTTTYKTITKDPINKLTQMFRGIKNQGGLGDYNYRKVYPHQCGFTMFYGLPKIHKVGTPLRHIVSSRGFITYWVAKELANIICPLAGQSPHYLKNTHFAQHIKEVKLEPGEVITSCDVKTPFSSVPMDPSINIIKQKLQQDPLLTQRTSMSIQQIFTLL